MFTRESFWNLHYKDMTCRLSFFPLHPTACSRCVRQVFQGMASRFLYRSSAAQWNKMPAQWTGNAAHCVVPPVHRNKPRPIAGMDTKY